MTLSSTSSMGLSYLFDTAYERQPQFREYIANYLELIKVDNPLFDESQLGLAKQNLKVEFYRQFFQSLGQVVFNGILFTDKVGTLLDISVEAQKVLEYDRKHILGLSIFEVLVPDSLSSKYQQFFQKGLLEGPAYLMKPRSFSFKKGDGSVLKVKLRINPLTIFGTTFFALSFQKEEQEVSSIQSNEIIKFFELIPGAMFTVDPGTKRVTDANQAFTELFSYAQDELFALTLYDLFSLPNHMVDQWCELQMKEHPLVYEPFTYLTRNGGNKTVEHVASSFLKRGEVQFVIFVQDTAKEESAVSNVSIGQILNLSNLYLEPVTQFLKRLPDAEQPSAEVAEQATFLATMMHDIPALLNKTYSFGTQSLDFNAILEQAQSFSHPLEFFLDAELPDTLRGDTPFFKYLFFYLAELAQAQAANEYKVMVEQEVADPERNKVTVVVQVHLTVPYFTSEQEVRWKLIGDFGTDMQNKSELYFGILHQMAQRHQGRLVFFWDEDEKKLSMYFTFDLNYEGAGSLAESSLVEPDEPLDLPTIEEVTPSLDVSPESPTEVSSDDSLELPSMDDFEFSFEEPLPEPASSEPEPVAAEPEPPAESPEEASPAFELPSLDDLGTMPNTAPLEPKKQAKILLAEDAPEIANLFRRLLREEPFDITHVDNGRKALEAIKSESFDLIFMDIHMPEMDGYEATTQIRDWEKVHDQSFTPIVALTSDLLGKSKESEMEFGFNEFHSKPFKKDLLLGVIHRYLTEKTPIDILPTLDDIEDEIILEPVAETVSESGEPESLPEIPPPEPVPAPAEPVSEPVPPTPPEPVPPASSSDFKVTISADLASLVPSFMRSREQDIEKIQHGIREKDFDHVRLIGQSMASVSGLYGFETLKAMGQSFEDAASEQNMKVIIQTLVKYKKYIEQVEVIVE